MSVWIKGIPGIAGGTSSWKFAKNSDKVRSFRPRASTTSRGRSHRTRHTATSMHTFAEFLSKKTTWLPTWSQSLAGTSWVPCLSIYLDPRLSATKNRFEEENVSMTSLSTEKHRDCPPKFFLGWETTIRVGSSISAYYYRTWDQLKTRRLGND